MTQRPFADVHAVFQASQPKKKLKSFEDIHFMAEQAWSFKSLKNWPNDPPVTTLLKVRDPRDYSENIFESAASLVTYANFKNVIGTWNAGGTGQWVGGEGWIIASIDLTQEQAGDEEADGDYVSMILALWTLSDGWAAAVLRSNEQAFAAALVGLPEWPTEGWKQEPVWFGE